MKTLSVTLFSYAELSAEVQEKVLDRLVKERENDHDLHEYTLRECMDSLTKITEDWGYPLIDWSVGPHDRCFARIRHSHNEMPMGHKALASFLRLLINKGYERPKHFKDMQFPGVCGFTGVCFDDDLCETIWTKLLGGSGIATAIDACADRIGKICEEDIEYQCKKETILEWLDETVEIYLEDGTVYEHS